MKKKPSNNHLLIAAFALPILLIIMVALTTYIPSLFLKTSYNFIYTSCDTGTNSYIIDCKKTLHQRYQIVNNRLQIQPVYVATPPVSRIFLHNTTTNQSREITEAEARSLQITDLITSPDGVTVNGSYDGGTSFLLFYNSKTSYNYYLTKGNQKKKMNLINDDTSYYRENFKFIGWVN